MAAAHSGPSSYPPGTCDTCQKITLQALQDTFDAPDYLHEWLALSYPDIRSSSASCQVCAIIIKVIKDPRHFEGTTTVYLSTDTGHRIKSRSRPEDLLDVRVRHVVGEGCSGPCSPFSFRVYTDESSAVSKLLLRRPIHQKESAEAKRQINEWIQTCNSSHVECKHGLSGETEGSGSILPSRLVSVGSSSQPPHLAITKGDRGRYVALSHRWGGTAQVSTTNANIEDHQVALPFERLSRTFQEAILFARSLDIPYIWIDSLCIKQDDPQDWLEEAKQMGTIYERAYLTIAATSGVDGDHGLFRDGRPKYVKFPCGPNSPDTDYMYFANIAAGPNNDIELAPLNERGWVLQERILSRRILHFASTQTYWECRKSVFCQSEEFLEDMGLVHQWGQLNQILNEWGQNEFALTDDELLCDPVHVESSNPLILSKPFTTERTTYITTQHCTFHLLWMELVRYYSCRDLTKTSDREIALEGIRERLQTRMGFGCISGHWNDTDLCFLKSLTWAVHRDRNVSNQPPPSRAPSWSWLAFEHSIWYPQESRTWAHLEWAAFGLEDYGMEVIPPLPTPGDQPGALAPLRVNGILKKAMKGPRVPANGHTDEDYYSFSITGMHYSDEDGRNTAQGTVTGTYVLKSESNSLALGWVKFDLASREPDSFFCCPVYLSPDCIPCLVLRESENYPGSFERVGLAIMCKRQHFVEVQDQVDKDLHNGMIDWLKESRRSVFEIV